MSMYECPKCGGVPGVTVCCSDAQPEQTVPASCGECGKKTSDGWALYCVACMESAGLPAQAGQVLTDDDLRRMWAKHAPNVGGVLDYGKEIEQAVRAKMGVAVPMTTQELAAALDAAVDYGTVDEVDMWAFIEGIEAAEKFHGIVGKEGA